MRSADSGYSAKARRADESPVWLVTGAAQGAGYLNARLRGLRELRTTRRRPVRLRRGVPPRSATLKSNIDLLYYLP
jgi:hypothetical protein